MERKIEDLQKQLERERERHEMTAGELSAKRRELDDEQQKFLQQQIDEQNKRLGRLYYSIISSNYFTKYVLIHVCQYAGRVSHMNLL